MADLLNLGSVYATMEMRMQGWNKNITGASKDLKGLRGFASRNETAINKLSKGFAIAGVAIAGAMALAFKEAMEFNKEIANVATLMPTATAEIINLKKNIQSLSVEYAKDTTDLARGAYQVVSAFGEEAASSRKLEIATIAATAGVATTSEAINYLSAVSKGYNTTTDEQLDKISDLGFMTVKLGQTTFPELAASIGKTVPLSEKLGVRSEELHAIFATLSGVTGNTAEVATQYTGVLRALMKPTDGMIKAMDELGYTTGEEMLKSMGLVEALNKLVATTDGTTISVGKLFGRAEAMTALFSLTGASAAKFSENLGKIDTTSGATVEALTAMTSGVNAVGFQFEQTKKRLTVLVQTLGETLMPVIGAMMTALSPLVSVLQFVAKSFETLPAPVKIVVGGLAALTATTLLATAAGLKFMVLWKNMPATFLKAAAAIGPYIIALGAAVVAAKLLEAAFNRIGAAHDRQMAKMQDNMSKEKAMLDKIMAFRKQATGKDLELIKESGRIANGLENNSYEERLKWQTKFLAKRSVNFNNFNTQKITEVKNISQAEIKAEIETNKKIEEIKMAAREKYVAGTIEEFQFRIEMAEKAYEKEKQILKDLDADDAAFIEIKKAYDAELIKNTMDRLDFIKSMEEEAAEAKKKREEEAVEAHKVMNAEFYDYVKSERLALDAFIIQQDEIAQMNALVGRERERAELDMWHEEQRMKLIALLEFKFITTEQYAALIAELERQYRDGKEEKEKSALQKWAERMLLWLQKQYEYFQAAASAYNGYLKAKKKSLDAWYNNENKARDANYKKEKKAIENSQMSEEKKNAALAALDLKYQQSKEVLDEEYNKKKSALMTKQAKLDKAANIASAIMNTAAGVTKALGLPFPLSLGVAALIGILGAAQVAIIMKTPIPAMKEGGMTSGEGLAYLHPNEVVMPLEKVNNIFAPQNDTESEKIVNINISALDGADIERVLYDKLIPALEFASQNSQIRLSKKAVVENV